MKLDLNKLFDQALPVISTVETVGRAAGLSGLEKRGQAVALLAERINDRVDLPPFVEENTDEFLGFVVDAAIWGLNNLLGDRWEEATPMRGIAQHADAERLKVRLGRG